MEWLRRQVGAHVEWLPYDLHPEYPPDGISRRVLVERYGDHFAAAVADLAHEAGLPFSPHPERVPRTRRALELGEWARTAGAEEHERLHDRLMDAYWAEGRDLGDWEVLIACADEVGLDGAAGRTAVEEGRHAEAVDAWTLWARQRGISAIPAFVFEERVLVSGAMPHEVLERAAATARGLMAEEG